MAGHVRVVTFNMWGDREPLAARLDAAAAGLAELFPDVILLQEVRAGEGLVNTAEQLASRLDGFSVTYRPATVGEAGTWGPGSARGEEGLAILSRHPVLEVRDRELPEARPDERRIVLSARIQPPGGAAWFHTTHLHWRLADGAARERQIVALDDACRELGWAETHILGGDLNAAPACDEIRFLKGQCSLGGRRTYWIDAYARVRGNGDAGWTWASRNPSTAWLKWLERDRRIDYVMTNGERADGRGGVLDARVVLDAPVGGVWPSDHFAVMADVGV